MTTLDTAKNSAMTEQLSSQGLRTPRDADSPAPLNRQRKRDHGGNGRDVTRPLQRVEMDEWYVDLASVLAKSGLLHHLIEEDRVLLGLEGSRVRWWLTVAMCSTTRCIVGMRLARAPSTQNAVQVLDMIMQNTEVRSDGAEALTPWQTVSTPDVVATDCGSTFTSREIRLAAQDLGVRLECAPAGFPQMRARIERLLGTMSDTLASQLTGRTIREMIDSVDRDPAMGGALSAEDLSNAVVRWVVDVYHRTPQVGLGGSTPIETWDRLVSQFGVNRASDFGSAEEQDRSVTATSTGWDEEVPCTSGKVSAGGGFKPACYRTSGIEQKS